MDDHLLDQTTEGEDMDDEDKADAPPESGVYVGPGMVEAVIDDAPQADDSADPTDRRGDSGEAKKNIGG